MKKGEKIELLTKLDGLAKRLQRLAREVRKMRSDIEGSAGLNNRFRSSEPKKAKPGRLVVTFPDGRSIADKTATDTFVKTIEEIGIEESGEIRNYEG